MDKALHSKRKSPQKDSGNAILYLVFSFLSGVLETGIVTAGLMRFGISTGLTLALAYQIGCLARNPLRLSLQGAACILCCSLPLSMSGHNSVLVLLMVTVLVSAGIQSAREWLLPKLCPVSLNTKRIVRVSGFICGILGGFAIGLSLITCISIATCLTILPLAIRQERKAPWMNLNRRFISDGYGWIMLLHQTHYFAYAYVMLAILLASGGQHPGEPILWQPVKASGWFALGWLSYISGRWLLKEKFKMSALQAAITGHTWVAVCLVCMGLFRDHSLVLGIAWVLSGFGGGSVYAINELARLNGCRADVELWEHWGHVVGVSLSLISVFIFPRYIAVPFVLALVATLATLILLSQSPVVQPT